jgi:hypothetical protein
MRAAEARELSISSEMDLENNLERAYKEIRKSAGLGLRSCVMTDLPNNIIEKLRNDDGYGISILYHNGAVFAIKISW